MRLSLCHQDWVLGYQDEVWFSRLAQPPLHAWTADKPLRRISPCVCNFYPLRAMTLIPRRWRVMAYCAPTTGR